jgi:carboxyl-terminal processing protease
MKLLYVLALGLLLQACGGGGSDEVAAPPPVDPGNPPAACSIADQQQTLRTFMNEEYYWYAGLANPDPAASSLDAYFDSMLFKPTDRFSYTQTTESYNQVFALGRRTGYGYTLAWDDAAQTTLRVRNLEPEGPVAKAGLRRGDIILDIDGVGPAQVVAGALPTVTTVGVPRTFHFRDSAGTARELTVLSEDFALTPILKTTTFDATRAGAPVKVGYLAYTQFVSYNLWELALKMQQFADAGVGEMIIDLRYNGGGNIGTSRDLASMISGSRTDGAVFTSLKYNDKLSSRNFSFPFMTAATRFTRPIEGLNRVFVIASGSTASASELLINGLKPHMQVVLVGSTTYGKPFGFAPRSYCGTTYNAVQFETVNSLGVGGFTSGFTPDCAVPDDLGRELGDPAEGRTRAVLDYVESGRCSTQAPLSASLTKSSRKEQAFGEVPRPQMFTD